MRISKSRGRRPIRLLVILGLLSIVVGIAVFSSTYIYRAQALGSCPCSIFEGASPSFSAYNENSQLTLGMRFASHVEGYVTGVQFYKDAQVTGTNKGSLWDQHGNLMATGTFDNQTSSGWQKLVFATPIAIDADTYYIVSYTTDNYYVATNGVFSTMIDNYPLYAPADAIGSRNGVYAVGDNTFPSNYFGQSSYWVDVTFVGIDASNPPTVTSSNPSVSQTNVEASVQPSVTLTTQLDTSTVTSGTAAIVTSNDQIVPTSISVDQTGKIITLHPSNDLNFTSDYKIVLKGGSNGILSLNGIPLSGDVEIPFTVAIGPDCPCSYYDRMLSSSTVQTARDSPVELGVKIRSSLDGYILGVRYFAQLSDMGSAKTARLWSPSGALVASATSSGNTSSGWRTISFSSPVAIQKNVDYTIAYGAANGLYVYDTVQPQATSISPITVLNSSSYYTYTMNARPTTKSDAQFNYLIDPIFSNIPGDQAPVHVTSIQPSNNSFGISTEQPLFATFDSALDVSTVATDSLQLKAGHTIVAGTTTYVAKTAQLVFKPNVSLNPSTTYTLSINAGLRSEVGNSLDDTDAKSVTFTTGAMLNPTLNDGKGGPILVVKGAEDPFSNYTSEILRSEGINYFKVTDINLLTGSLLNDYKYLLLGSVSLSATQVQDITAWVHAGGNLIAFKPDNQLNALLGVIQQPSVMGNQYLKIDTSTAPGKGIFGDTMQYHGAANGYTLAGAKSIANFYSNATTSTPYPAITTHMQGSGSAVAFSYNLPESIVLTHQGNPACVGNKPYADSDGPMRPDALFRCNASPNWLDVTKAHIPQADEQQRLLVNVLNNMSEKSGPLPHYWYLPHGYKAAMVMASDDHATDRGTSIFFDTISLRSPNNCSTLDWTCPRASSLLYIDVNAPTSDQADIAHAYGYELGIHVNTGCSDTTKAYISSEFASQLNNFATAYPGLPNQKFSRSHCYMWNGWVDTAKIGHQYGVRLTMEYEWYPSNWTNGNAGIITGSSMIMRFADLDGTFVDVYNAPTDLDYETDPTDTTMLANLNAATGSSGFYGMIGTHYDYTTPDYQLLLINTARQFDVPLITPDQAIAWKDAQTSSTISILSSNEEKVVFEPTVAEGGAGSTLMLPTTSKNGSLTSLTNSSQAVSYDVSTIKGVQYAIFPAKAGIFTALFGTQSTPVVDTEIKEKAVASNTTNSNKRAGLAQSPNNIKESTVINESLIPSTGTDEHIKTNPHDTKTHETPAGDSGIWGWVSIGGTAITVVGIPIGFLIIWRRRRANAHETRR